MSRIVDRTMELLARLLADMTSACLRHRALVVVLSLAACAWLGLGVARLEAVSSIRGFIPADDPELVAFDRFLEEFPADSSVLVLVSCEKSEACSTIEEAAVLEKIRDLEGQLAAIDGIQATTSLWTAPIVRAAGSSIQAVYLSEIYDLGANDARAFLDEAVSSPLHNGSVVSGDLKSAGLLLEAPFWRLNSADRSTQRLLVARLLRTASQFGEGSGLVTFVVGPPISTELSAQNTQVDLRVITPLMLLAVVLTFAWIFQGVVVAIAPMIAVGVSTLLSFGLMGHFGVPVTTVSSVLPTLIVVIGVTDAMHLLTRYFHHRDRGLANAEGLVLATRELGVPSLVTALTGSAGLLSFLLGPMPRLREFGVFASLGVMAGFVTTFTLLPVLIDLFPPRARLRRGLVLGDRVLDRVRRFSLVHPGVLISAAGGVLLAGSLGIGSLRVQNELLELLDENDYIYRSEVFVRENLRPTRTLEVVLEATPRGSITDPAALRELARVESLLLAQPQIPRVDSVLPLLRRVMDLLELDSGDDSALPTSRGQAEETLFLLDSAAPQVAQSYLSVDRALVRLSAGFLYSDTKTDLATIERVRAALPELAPSWDASITGTTSLSVRLSELILETQVASFSGAFLTIFVILAILVGSVRLALLGMIPNLLPVVAILGLMGYWGIRLDVGTAMVASILIGISVDDTVYFLLHYRNARRRGLELDESIAYTFGFSGKAALFSSVILSGGFLLLTFSRFQTLAYFGMLCALAVVAALVCELLLLPAVLERSLRIESWVRGRLRVR